MSNFLRWNETTHILELSTDLGASWSAIPLDASILTQGLLNASRIPSLDASKIGTGVIDAARIPSIVNAMIDAAAAIVWTKIDKSGSSLADLATRSAGDLNSGTLGASLYADFVASGASHAKGAVPDPGSTAGTLRYLREDATFVNPVDLANCRVTNNANQSIANGASYVSLTFNTEVFDNGGMHDNVANNTRITFPTAGVYIIGASAVMQAAAANTFYGRIYMNGATDICYQVVENNLGGNMLVNMSVLVSVAANEYAEFQVRHTYGSARNSIYVANYAPMFWAAQITKV